MAPEQAKRSRRRTRARVWVLSAAFTLLPLALILAAATARLMIWPAHGTPAHVDAIVVLDGEGDRFESGIQLARAHRAPMLVISTSTPIPTGSSGCAPKLQGIRVVCFNPVPKTTQGEAEFAGRLARRYHWRSVALITIAPQNFRARLRLGRCFGGRIYAVDAPFPASAWPYQIAYQWAALAKAWLLQRSC
jgi:uncharacterized SAM-binding protein YcdF (DUF218 family)